MGRKARRAPVHLSKKLLRIRKTLGLSQSEMVQRMGLAGEVLREEVSDFERGRRVPPLLILLRYAQAANVYVDALIDDTVKLPTELPRQRKPKVR